MSKPHMVSVKCAYKKIEIGLRTVRYGRGGAHTFSFHVQLVYFVAAENLDFDLSPNKKKAKKKTGEDFFSEVQVKRCW